MIRSQQEMKPVLRLTGSKQHFARMATVILWAVICVIVCLGPASDSFEPAEVGTSAQASRPVVIKPDVCIQELLNEVVVAVQARDEDEFKRLMSVLKQQGGTQYVNLIPQLVLYSAQLEDAGNGDMMKTMLPGMVIEQLGITDWQLVNALIPCLGVDDLRVNGRVEDCLGGTEHRTSSGVLEFTHYKSFIAGRAAQGQELQRELVLYMYKREPGEAALCIMHATVRSSDQTRPILWAEHQVSDVLWKWQYAFLPKDKVEPVAAEALAKLVDHPQWWARYYVAEIMRRHPPFRNDVLIETLASDSDESVRKLIEKILAEDG